MKVKQRFARQTIGNVIQLSILIALSYYFFNRALNDIKDSNIYSLCIVLLLFIVVFTYGIYELGYNSRVILINDNGITQKWFGILTLNAKWLEFQYVKVDTLRSFYANSSEYKSIICSKIPIQYREVPVGNSGYKKVIDMMWPLLRPGKVVTVFVDDLKPGQYEEFWSYVPESLKT